MRRHTLDLPHPRHLPTVEPRPWGAGYTGTTVRCSCARGCWHVSQSPPATKVARAAVRRWYRQHVADLRPQVDLSRPQLDVLQQVHLAPEPLRTSRTTTPWWVHGGTAASLVRHGLLRWATIDSVECTPAGCAVLAQWDAWGWPPPRVAR